MTDLQIRKIVERLESLGYSQSSEINRKLRSIIYRLECADYGIELLKAVDFAQVNHFDEMNKFGATPGQYYIKNTKTTILCEDNKEVAFHIKRIVAEIFVSLDNSVDIMWECLMKLYKPNPGITEKLKRWKLIDLIAATDSELAIKIFLKRHFQDVRDFRRAIDYIRNSFTHDDYLMRNDIDSKTKEDAYGQVEFSARAVFKFGEELEGFSDSIPLSDREYAAFCQHSIEGIQAMYSDLLNTLETDLSNCAGVPLQYSHNNT